MTPSLAPPGSIQPTTALLSVYTRRWPDGIRTTACVKLDGSSHDERVRAFRSAVAAVLKEAGACGVSESEVFGVAGPLRLVR